MENSRVDIALSIVSKRFADPTLSLSKLSEALGVSEDHFSRLFKKELQRPFCDYVRQLRIQRAKHLLLNSNDEVKAIAAAVGYSSHSYFTQHFRERVGMSPRQFREARQSGGSKRLSAGSKGEEMPEK